MTTNITTASPLPYFNIAQTFLVDGSLAPNNTLISITGINVYFEYMPAANGNSSSIQNPGVTLYLANATGTALIAYRAANTSNVICVFFKAVQKLRY